MNSSKPHAVEGLSDSERSLLRRSVREFLSTRWPVERAVEQSGSTQAIAALWRDMAGQGLASLGSNTAEVGLREIVLVFEELGRASCPAPLLGAVGANLALANQQSNCRTRPARRSCTRARPWLLWRSAPSTATRLRDESTCAATRCREKPRLSKVRRPATHFLIFTDAPAGVAVVASDAPGIEMQVTPGLAVPPFSELTFNNTPAIAGGHIVRNARGDRADGEARLRRPGARRGRARIRTCRGSRQGQEAIRPVHRSVPGRPAQAGQLPDQPGRRAADARSRRPRRGTTAIRTGASSPASALAFAGPALRAVSIETHRALGAIGYAEEHEAPRHFRRVHADLARFGGVPRARAELADFLLGPVQ